MKISKQSWHYRLLTETPWGMLDYRPSQVSNNLCVYFWQVIFQAIMVTIAIGIITGLIAFFLVIPLVEGVAAISTGVLLKGSVLQVLILVFGTILLIVLVATMAIKLTNYLPKKSVTLIGSYLKAKKENVCPVLEFKND